MFSASELWNRYRPNTNTMLMLAAIATLAVMAATPNLMRTNVSPVESQRISQTRFESEALLADVAPMATPQRSLGVIGGVPGGARAGELPNTNLEMRQVVKTARLDLVTSRPSEDLEKVRALAERLHGYVVSSQIQGYAQDESAMVTIRVPSAQMDEARIQIRKLGLSTEADRTDTNDVTKQYVDMEARLRNYRAEEAQYLAILKQTRTVKDMLAVSEHLSEVRQEIEQLQGEFNYLARQVEMASITVELRSQGQAEVLGIHWRPLYQAKLAVIDGLDAVADYATSMLGLLMRLPAILLWVATVVCMAAIGWRLLKWIVALFLHIARRTPAPANPA
jgi:hypothetical protein